MTRIDFYIDAPDRLQVACRVVAKAMAQRLRVLIYAPATERANAIDRLLWTTPPIGFVPHVAAGHRLASETPVLISADADAPGHDDVLLNLHDEWPAPFARFQRLVEIVSRDEADKQAARARYKFYRDRGYPIQTHNLAELGG